jgi:alanine-glyoxylate transaminase/serine-glyoxylate transaminase/serine-pyruvate transaminase
VGRHFLQIPGPTNVPDRVLRAIDAPTIDHRGPAFAELGREVLDGMAEVLRTDGPVVIYPSSGTGAWEAALVNTLSPGDRVLAFETGHFATLWRAMAERLGLEVDWIEGDWRHGVDPDKVAAVLRSDPSIAAVTVVHNETSTESTRPRCCARRASPRRRSRRCDPVGGPRAGGVGDVRPPRGA